MFVRLKTSSGDNVTLIAHKIVAFSEEGTGDNRRTVVAMDNGVEYEVVESERVIRSKIEKSGQPENAE